MPICGRTANMHAGRLYPWRDKPMSHPYAAWTRERLGAYVGTTETLTLEFKSYRALLPGDNKNKDMRLHETA